jgi:signal transduction histidine kinase
MKIRERLALFITVLAWALLLSLSGSVYFFSAQHERAEFTQRLRERVEITEQLFVEADRLDSTVLANIREKFLHTLPDEREEVLEIPQNTDSLRKALQARYPVPFIESVFQDTSASFLLDKRQGVGKWFRKAEGGFLVIVTAEDRYGNQQLHYLQRVLLVGLLVSTLLIFPLVWAYVRTLLRPLEEKIDLAREISASNLHLRLPVGKEQDEMGQLSLTFNAMFDRLEKAFLLQKQFISNASHEIKNPLTAIIGQTEISLEKPRSPEESRATLQLIQQEAERLKRLVDNLLGLATTDQDVSQFKQEPVRLDELLMDLVTTYAAPRKVPVEIRLPEEVDDPDLWTITANAELIQLAIANLLDNAIKYSVDQGVLVSLSYQGGKVSLTIQDQGIGIPPGDLPYVFEPLYRAENARTHQGFGIGLSLTRRIIELHQAELHMTSEPNIGTRVILSF